MFCLFWSGRFTQGLLNLQRIDEEFKIKKKQMLFAPMVICASAVKELISLICTLYQYLKAHTIDQ